MNVTGCGASTLSSVLTPRNVAMSAHFIFHGPHDLHDLVRGLLESQRCWWSRNVDAEIDLLGDVHLTGCVNSWYEKQVAQETLRQVRGIRRVHNELCVVR